MSFTPESWPAATAVYNYGSTEPRVARTRGHQRLLPGRTGDVFHTYSTYARGIDMVNGAYQFLDLVPKGRDEAGATTRSSGCVAMTSTATDRSAQRLSTDARR